MEPVDTDQLSCANAGSQELCSRYVISVTAWIVLVPLPRLSTVTDSRTPRTPSSPAPSPHTEAPDWGGGTTFQAEEAVK